MPKVIWRQDNETRTVFNNVEDFELHLAHNAPPPLGLLLNILYAVFLAIEVQLEQRNNASPGSYRGLFYRRFGPFNAAIETLRQITGPSDLWGISRILHEEGEPHWPLDPDID
jgi:hypothetical protein